MIKIYIEDRVLTAIMKKSEMVVSAEMLIETITKTTTNPRESDVQKKIEKIRMNTNPIGLVKLVGSGSNDFKIERIPFSAEDGADEEN